MKLREASAVLLIIGLFAGWVLAPVILLVLMEAWHFVTWPFRWREREEARKWDALYSSWYDGLAPADDPRHPSYVPLHLRRSPTPGEIVR